MFPTPASRRYKSGCPYCAGKLPVKGETDFLTKQPELAAEWDYSKNNGRTPEEFTECSGYRADWKCIYGHDWDAKISDRVTYQSGCPICSKRKIVPGVNTLDVTHPHVARRMEL